MKAFKDAMPGRLLRPSCFWHLFVGRACTLGARRDVDGNCSSHRTFSYRFGQEVAIVVVKPGDWLDGPAVEITVCFDMVTMRIPLIALALSAAFWLTGCAGSSDTFLAPSGLPTAAAGTASDAGQPAATGSTVRPASFDPASDRNKDFYAAAFPFYAELCALSEINKKPGFGAEFTSGFGGHAVLYLNGVCRVADAGYPTIKMCDGDATNRGVGLSVNDHFKNANWVATEGKSFLFYGSLKPGDTVDPAGYQRTQAAAMRAGIFDGVEFHDEFFAKMPPGTSRRAYMYELSIATDYAINFGRDRYCARVPMSREQMTRVVTYLNQANQPYRTGAKEFHWNVLSNNCSHLTHNALAAAGIWAPIAMGQPFFISAFEFPVPKNEFVNLMQRTNDLPIDDLMALYDDGPARQSLLQHDYLPMHAGALAEVAPVMPRNQIYDTHPRLIFYDPIGRYQRAFEAMLADPRYLDLRSNLGYFAALYQRIKAERKPVDWYLARRKVPTSEAADFTTFYQHYYAYIDRQSSATEAKLAALNSAPATAPSLIGASLGAVSGPGTTE